MFNSSDGSACGVFVSFKKKNSFVWVFRQRIKIDPNKKKRRRQIHPTNSNKYDFYFFIFNAPPHFCPSILGRWRRKSGKLAETSKFQRFFFLMFDNGFSRWFRFWPRFFPPWPKMSKMPKMRTLSKAPRCGWAKTQTFQTSTRIQCSKQFNIERSIHDTRFPWQVQVPLASALRCQPFNQSISY